MFSLFRSRRHGETEVVPTEDDFFRRYERLLPNRSVFKKQGESHAEIDLRLVQKIEDLLVPKLGAWEQTDRWFHQMDFYGNGVRSLVFRRDLFPRSDIPALRSLLIGEHAEFTILCRATESLLGRSNEQSGNEDDYLAIWHSGFLATRRLADTLSGDA